MSAPARKKRAPNGLDPSGRALWSRITGTYRPDPHGLQVLEHACRESDDLAALEESIASEGRVIEGSAGPRLNPATTEARLARLSIGRLLNLLALPSEEDARPMTAGSRYAQRAAVARWDRHRARKERLAGGEAGS